MLQFSSDSHGETEQAAYPKQLTQSKPTTNHLACERLILAYSAVFVTFEASPQKANPLLVLNVVGISWN